MDGSWQGDHVAGENVAVLFRESGAFRSEDRACRVRVVQWFAFSGGKVSRINEIVAITED